MRKFLPLALLGFLVCLLLTACMDDDVPTSDQRMNQQQEQLSNDAVSAVGFPAIRNYQEKRMMKEILELRDKAISTYTYIIDMQGKKHFFCSSQGYGLPYSTQYTSPMKIGSRSCPGTGCSVAAIPQADPNGLFSPAAADGTWVLCRDPNPDKAKNRGTMPVYVEPRVIVSPFELPLE